MKACLLSLEKTVRGRYLEETFVMEDLILYENFMNNVLKIAAVGLFLFVFQVSAQVPVATQVAIMKAEDARDYNGLKPFLSSKNIAVQRRALLAAGRIGNAAAVPDLVEILETNLKVPSVLHSVAFAVGEIESIAGADVIMLILKSESGFGKRDRILLARAVEAAGKIAAANPTEAASKELGLTIVRVINDEREERAVSPSPEVVRAGATAILRTRPEGGAEAVAAFLDHSDNALVAESLNTLSRLRFKGANEKARELLTKSTDPIIRANAARLLGAADDKDSAELLIDAATKDKDSRVRVSAIRSLGALKIAATAEPLIKYGGTLMLIYSKAAKPNYIPLEHSEFVELAVAIGQIIPGSFNEDALKLFKEFANHDNGVTPEVYVARVRIAPSKGDGSGPELTNWKQHRTLAQIVGEFAVIEPATEEGKQIKANAPTVLGPLAKAFAVADPKEEAATILAAPDVLRAYARFKTEDLAELLRVALRNKDVQIRAAAASLIGDLPPTKENSDAVKAAFGRSLIDDKTENDATLSLLSAAVKLDKPGSFDALRLALNSPDHLVRIRARDLIRTNKLQDEFADAEERVEPLKRVDPRSGSKLGVILNTDTDYRRAALRKNGTVRAVFTTQKGNFTIDLLPEDAPLTVDNFIKLANAKYFDGLEVHRVVPNFVMQDGDPRGDGTGGPGWNIRCEVNMVPYGRGSVGMALSGKDTGGSQWFVTHAPQPHLDGGYTVFGKVNETGMKVVDNIVRGDKILTVRIVGR